MTEAVLIYEAFVMYAFTAALAIIGQIPIFYMVFWKDPSSKLYASITILSNVMVFIFQLCLIVIFNKLISIGYKSRSGSLTDSKQQIHNSLEDTQVLETTDNLAEEEMNMSALSA